MKFLLVVGLSACFLTGYSQEDKNQFYALDAAMNQTVLDSSKYILWIHEKEDSNWQWDYYYTWGPLIKSHSFADHDGKIPNGRFCIYNTIGNLDSTGIYVQGKKNGNFLKLGSHKKDSVEIIASYEYVQDSLIKKTDLVQSDSSGGNEKEPEFPGGPAAWESYLRQTLQYPDRAKAKDIQGLVKIYFKVDEEGDIKDPFIEKSVEYSLDQEALRIIRKSGRWIPGMKNGIKSNTYKSQPLNFKLQD
jgi:periplasmic protein TonB